MTIEEIDGPIIAFIDSLDYVKGLVIWLKHNSDFFTPLYRGQTDQLSLFNNSSNDFVKQPQNNGKVGQWRKRPRRLLITHVSGTNICSFGLTMNKKYTVFLFVLLFIGTLGAWYLNQLVFSFLPTEVNNFFVLFLTILGSVTTIQMAIAAIKWLVDLFIIIPPPPNEIENLKQELRSHPGSLSNEKAHYFTAKILLEKENDFWNQISSETLNRGLFQTLSKDPFWLEGLIDLYQQNKDCRFPDAPDILLKKLIMVQWTPEKIGSEGFVNVKVVEMALDNAVNSINLYERHEWLGNQDVAYKNILYALSKRNSHNNSLSIKSQYFKFVNICKNTRDNLIKKIRSLPSPWAKMFFFLLERFIRNVRYIYRILTLNYLIEQIRLKNGKKLLNLLEKAHILTQKGYRIDFTNRYWELYFSSISNPDYLSIKNFQYNDEPSYWQERSTDREYQIGLMLSKNFRMSSDFIYQMGKSNPYLAGIILANDQELIPPLQNTREEIVKWIIENVQTNTWPETRRTYLLSSLLTKLCRNNPSVIVDILNSHDNDIGNGIYIGNEFLYIDFAKLIAQYGDDGVPVLRTVWRKYRKPDIQKIIIKALGEINSCSANSLLQEIMLEETKTTAIGPKELSYEISYYAATILATYYNNLKAYNLMLNALTGYNGPEEECLRKLRISWKAILIGGKESIRIAEAAIYNLYYNNQLNNPKFFYRKLFLDYLNGLNDCSAATNCLYELLKSSRKELQLLALQGLYGKKLNGGLPIVLECIHNQDQQIRLKALWVVASAKENQDGRILSALISCLYDPLPTLVAEAIEGLHNFTKSKDNSPKLLSETEKIRLLMDKINDHRIVTEVHNSDINNPITNMVGNPISIIALQEIMYEQAYLSPDQKLALISWCNNHLDDKQEFYDDGAIKRLVSIYATRYLAELQSSMEK